MLKIKRNLLTINPKNNNQIMLHLNATAIKKRNAKNLFINQNKFQEKFN